MADNAGTHDDVEPVYGLQQIADDLDAGVIDKDEMERRIQRYIESTELGEQLRQLHAFMARLHG